MCRSRSGHRCRNPSLFEPGRQADELFGPRQHLLDRSVRNTELNQRIADADHFFDARSCPSRRATPRSIGSPFTLPAAASGDAFERTDQVRRDPAAVEISRLRLNTFVADEAGIDAVRVEREMVAEN